MPVNTEELIILMDKKTEYDSIIQQVRDLFISEATDFDKEWRNKFMSSLV